MSKGFFSHVTYWLGQAAESLNESLFQHLGTPYGNLNALLLGGIAAVLLLSGSVLTAWNHAIIFSVTLLVTLALFLLVGTYRGIHKFAWGPVTIVLIGFGLGTLIYHYRGWSKWLWAQFRKIDEPHEFVLGALFLIGVMLGVFVVRNWAKEQKAFVESISAILSGTFVAGILAKLFDAQPGMSQKAFAY
jgi:prepilin signal peptidase PulO-like enzyme (type II secretory pathway)